MRLRDINFLGRLPAAWRILRDYTRLHRTYTLNFYAIKSPFIGTKFNSIRGETLLDKINSCPQSLPRKKAALKMRRLQKPGQMDHFVHCEMQLLLHIDASSKDEAFFPYFGCRKLPCWICSEILEFHAGFRIKATHGRIGSLYALDCTNHSSRRVFAIKRLDDELAIKLPDEAFRIEQYDKIKSMRAMPP